MRWTPPGFPDQVGTYVVDLQYACDDAGTAVNPDVYVCCPSGRTCAFFAEEL